MYTEHNTFGRLAKFYWFTSKTVTVTDKNMMGIKYALHFFL